MAEREEGRIGITTQNVLKECPHRMSSQYTVISLVIGSRRVKTHIRQRNDRELSTF